MTDNITERAISLNLKFRDITQFLADTEASFRKEFSHAGKPNAPEMAKAATYWFTKFAELCNPKGSNQGVFETCPFNDFNDYSGPISDFYKKTTSYNPSEHIEVAREAGLRIG